MQNNYYHIINNTDVRLWSVPQHERIHKLMAKLNQLKPLKSLDELSSTDNILILHAEFLFDANVLSKLLGKECGVLTDSSGEIAVAAWISASQSESTIRNLGQSIDRFAAFDVFSPSDLTGDYDPRLRKFDLSHIVKVTSQHQSKIENYLYDKSYKGITDLVTKWFWPIPARWAVRQCVALNIKPNTVTGFGWILTIFSGFAFYFGHFVLGLLSAWLMTFLDTVDGKLARVTLQSSKIGHVMDHGLDILHPPIWYWCWAVGLQIEQFSLFSIELSYNALVLDHVCRLCGRKNL